MRGLGETDRAVAPVIAHVLLVALVVIIASIVAVFVFGIGENIINPVPSVAFETEQADGNVSVTHIGDDTVAGERIEIQGGNVTGEMPATLAVGDTITVEPDPSADEIVMHWEDSEKSVILLNIEINGEDADYGDVI